MKSSILLAIFGFAGIAASSVPAYASTSDFDFTQCSVSSNYFGLSQTENSACGTGGYSNTSNAFSQTVAGVKVTATAYATTTTDNGASGTTISGANTAAEVGQYTGNGIGVCSAEEDSENGNWTPGNSCSNGYHQVNNHGAYEFVLFTFSTPVNLSDIILANFGDGSLNGLDISYWVNPTSLTSIPAGATNVLCATGSDCPSVEGNGAGIGVGSLTDSISGTNVTTLLVGAETGDTNAFFKIQGLEVSASSGGQGPTPEPATFGMFGLALAGLGLLARKRKQI